MGAEFTFIRRMFSSEEPIFNTINKLKIKVYFPVKCVQNTDAMIKTVKVLIILIIMMV